MIDIAETIEQKSALRHSFRCVQGENHVEARSLVYTLSNTIDASDVSDLVFSLSGGPTLYCQCTFILVIS